MNRGEEYRPPGFHWDPPQGEKDHMPVNRMVLNVVSTSVVVHCDLLHTQSTRYVKSLCGLIQQLCTSCSLIPASEGAAQRPDQGLAG